MKKLFIIAVAVMCLMATTGAWGATYYMRADGSAANKAAATSCSAAASAMSVATHNAETFAAGDTIYLCDDGGDYLTTIIPPTTGTEGNIITYQAAPGDIPIINGSTDILGTTGSWINQLTAGYADTNTFTGATDNIYCSQFWSGTGGTVAAINYYIGTGASTVPGIKCAVYADKSGTDERPYGDPLAISEEKAGANITANAYNTFMVAGGGTLAPSTTYWSCIWGSEVAGEKYPNYGGKGSNGTVGTLARLGVANVYGDWPTSWNPGFDGTALRAGGTYITYSAHNTWRRTVTQSTSPYYLWLDGVYAVTGDETDAANMKQSGSLSSDGQWAYRTETGGGLTTYYVDIYKTSNPALAYSDLRISNLVNGFYINTKDYITLSGLSFKYINNAQYDYTNNSCVGIDDPYTGCTGCGTGTRRVNQNYDGAVNINSSSNVIVDSCSFNSVSLGVSSYGISADSLGTTVSNSSFVNIFHPQFYPFGIGIYFSGSDASATGNTINMLTQKYDATDYKAGIGILVKNGGVQQGGYLADGAVIDQNIISNYKKFGIYLVNYDWLIDQGESWNATISNNYVHDSGEYAETDNDFDYDGIGFGDFTSHSDYWLACFDEYSADTSKRGMTGISVLENRVVNNYNAGIHFANSQGAGSTIAYNIISGAGLASGKVGGIRARNGSSVFNNTIYNAPYGSGIIVDNASTGIGALSATTIINNIVVNALNQDGGKAGIYVQTEADATGSNNLVNGVTGGRYYTNFTNTDGLTSDPLFISATDFRLRPASPAINAGADLCATLVTATDYAGRPVCVSSAYVGRVAPEIGAYEYPTVGQSTQKSLNLLWMGK